MERELTEPVSLTGPDGRLNRDAVGWARTSLVDTSGIGTGKAWGRNKRWEYWSVTTPTHLIALTASSIDYAAVHEVWVFDRRTLTARSKNATVIPARGVSLGPSLGDTPVRAAATGLQIEIDEVPGGTRLRARIDGASFDIVAEKPTGHECLAVVVPWSDSRFQYTVKDVARPASGTLIVDGVEHPLPEGESWAVLDHGRGRWPYDVTWNWGAGSGVSNGRLIGIQVGGKWTEGTGSTENGFSLDGRMHKISTELTWDYTIGDWLRPWRLTGGGLDVTLTPFYDKVSRTNLGIVAASTDQVFGHWAGSFTTAEGERVEFDGILGFAEHVHNRW
ncbi:MAG: DUF2804 domain-containing protein [Salinibacterium sp.]|nr:DUF2804 domain-containing protein [Salinibacterium sp.]MBF0672154.1 DUF2804 domain-containing protein [Salinibacterium sp.]